MYCPQLLFASQLRVSANCVMAPIEDQSVYCPSSNTDVEEFNEKVDEVSAQIRGIIDGSITDFDELDRKLHLKERAKQIREEERKEKRDRFLLYGVDGKGEGKNYKWWCKRCFVEYFIELSENKCTRCKQSDKMMTPEQRREELMGKLDVLKADKAKHQFRKDKWLRWKKSQALLKRSKYINYKAWEYWEPDTDSDEEGDPIVPKDNPEFRAMEMDMKQRRKKTSDRNRTAERCRERGNAAMKDGDFVLAIEHYAEGLEYRRDFKPLWTNKALAELKVFRWHDAIQSCNKVIEYSEIFEDGFKKSADMCFKAFTRRAQALRALHRWEEALEDLEDAVKLFPKDRDARDLLEKTRAAREESKTVAQQRLAAAGEAQKDDRSASDDAKVDAPVNVAIEEELETEEAGEEVPAAGPNSIGSLSGKEFSTLLTQLRSSAAERKKFCARAPGGVLQPAKYDDSRKINLTVEEVVEPSPLDNLLKDAERCCILWRKGAGCVVPLRDDVKVLGGSGDDTDQEAEAFLRVVPLRLLKILTVLSINSDHHSELAAAATRHIWPLMSNEAWRYPVLRVLFEWSQRSVGAKVMAEFAGRNPEPCLRLLIDAVADEGKDSNLPPKLEERAKAAADRMARGEGTMESAMEDFLEGFSEFSLVELAIGTVGNVCLAGQNLGVFREHIKPSCERLVKALARHVKPLSWRNCGRAAGAICNVVRLGDEFSEAVVDHCSEPLVKALREEAMFEMPSVLDEALREQGPGSKLPMSKSAGRILGALVNLVVVRPAATERLVALSAIPVVVPLITPAALATVDGNDDDEGIGSPVVALRALMFSGRLLGACPSAIGVDLEAELFRVMHRLLRDSFDVIKTSPPPSEQAQQVATGLELVIRVLTILITKTPGALDRLTCRAPRVQELPDDMDQLPPHTEAPISFDDLSSVLVRLARKIRPGDYVSVEEENGIWSRTRGNLALLLAHLCDEQAKPDPPAPIRNLDLSFMVEIFTDCLRKERGKVQHNIGVFVTKLAQNPRYTSRVRDLKGFESLHQIQLPKANQTKEREMKLHRIRGPPSMQ